MKFLLETLAHPSRKFDKKRLPNTNENLFFCKWRYSLFGLNYSTCVFPLSVDHRIEFSAVICDCSVTVTLFARKQTEKPTSSHHNRKPQRYNLTKMFGVLT